MIRSHLTARRDVCVYRRRLFIHLPPLAPGHRQYRKFVTERPALARRPGAR